MQPERNTTVNAGPAIDPAPPIGARVAVHGWPFFDGETGTVTRIGKKWWNEDGVLYIVLIDSDSQTYTFAPEELETL